MKTVWGKEYIYSDKFCCKYIELKRGGVTGLSANFKTGKVVYVVGGKVILHIDEGGKLVKKILKPFDTIFIPAFTHYKYEGKATISRIIECSQEYKDKDESKLSDGYMKGKRDEN